MSEAEQKREEYAEHWIERINSANKYFEKWENKYRCRLLSDYVEGLQKAEGTVGYVLNLFYSSIKVKKPSLIFSRPTFTLAPKPWKYDWNPDEAFITTRLKQDTLNSFIQDSALKFAKEIDMAILDSWSYFGLIEVGYSANWIENPNAGRPVLKSDYYELDGNEKYSKSLQEPAEIPEKEFVYFRRIPAHRFRVGGSESHDLDKCNWCGYYEWVRSQDILNNKKYLTNISEKDWPDGRSSDYYTEYEELDRKNANFTTNGDYTKLWKIWDLRSKTKLLFVESQKVCIFKSPFKRLPLFGLKFDERRVGWYPIPVTFNWKGPQDELNDSRNQMRRHRKRVRQFWQAQENSVDADEAEKFISAEDGGLIWTKKDQAIREVQNSPLDSSVMNSLQISSDEFDKISATSNNQRGVSDRTTATESNTIETRTRIREETDQSVVAEWLCAIAKETLLIIIERFSEDFWIKRSADNPEPGEEYKLIESSYQLINAFYLQDKADFDVDITVTSLSPVTNEVEKRKFLEFMAILKEYDVFALHPTLIREAAFRCDYRNEQVIQALQKMAQLALIAKAEEGQANAQMQGAGNAAQNTVAAQTPPGNEEIRQQVESQLALQ